jgi:hypothetical protein
MDKYQDPGSDINIPDPQHCINVILICNTGRIRKFLGLPDPIFIFRGTDMDPSIIKQKYFLRKASHFVVMVK